MFIYKVNFLLDVDKMEIEKEEEEVINIEPQLPLDELHHEKIDKPVEESMFIILFIYLFLRLVSSFKPSF